MREVWLGSLVLVLGCAPEGSPLDAEGGGAEIVARNLPELSWGSYAVWGQTESGTRLVGTGLASPLALDPAADLRSVERIVVTVEETATPQEPGAAAVLEGDLTDGEGTLRFAVDLGGLSGGVSLWTPTDNDTDPDNHHQGAWFILRENDVNGAGLELPELAEGWTFSGWTRTQGIELPMGRFRVADAADDACRFCGPGESAPFPGEDFVSGLPGALTEEVNLRDGESAVVVSLEPDIWQFGGDDERFGISVMATDIPAGQEVGVQVELTLGTNLPEAEVLQPE